MTTHYKACCKPQVNARFENGELVQVWEQHFGFRCTNRREYIDPEQYAPRPTRVEPREPITPRRRRDTYRGSMHDPIEREGNIRGKRTFKSEPRSKANRQR